MNPLQELRRDLKLALAARLAIDPELIDDAVYEATLGWHADRVTTPECGIYPLAEQEYGHYLRVLTDWVPETAVERTERETRMLARHWAWEAHAYTLDLERGEELDDEPGPPPERVNVNELLEQNIWWRMRISRDPDDKTTLPIRLADMAHDHRLALLDFLRQRAPHYKMREDWAFAARPGPSGDMAQLAFEEECDRQWNTPSAKWLEDQPLIRALVYWTTPYAESPVTWHPMDEAPRDSGTLIMVRWAELEDLGEIPARWIGRTYHWSVEGGTGSFSDDAFTAWRELRPDEYCEHNVPSIEQYGRRVEYCRWCDHGHGPDGGDDCEKCAEELKRMDAW
jgi:hypothetical protein